MTTCPAVAPGPTPHVGGPIITGEPTVLTCFQPQARVTDKALCAPGIPATIVRGSATVIVGNKPAARIGDTTNHGGIIVTGCPTVLIGDIFRPSPLFVGKPCLKAAAKAGSPFVKAPPPGGIAEVAAASARAIPAVARGGLPAFGGGPLNGLLHLAQDSSGAIPLQSLAFHEARGGHAVRLHVGKNAEFLRRAVRPQFFQTPFFTVARRTHGSFPSLPAADRLVNSTLAQNAPRVAAVASGAVRRDYLTATFPSPTGQEAFRTAPRRNAPIVIRPTNSVGVVIEHAPDMPDGFVVVTAFPRNN